MITVKGYGAVASKTAYSVAKQNSVRLFVVTALGLSLAACASPTPDKKPEEQAATKEYFPESKYGVKASPRVASANVKAMPRGGGREQIGKPYKIRGKWYHPKEDTQYAKSGKASWYGSAFHGRLTANGEVYDMTHLTAAHPTMPLPSYARVTNKDNGSSVIVRVNDRGPYHGNRIIDLSQKAAEMLDYTHKGTANVMVEYIGRAPLHGNDDHFLMASFRPGDDQIGQPATGVMMAMNGTTPTNTAIPLPQYNILADQNQLEDRQAPAASDFGQELEQDLYNIKNIPTPIMRPDNNYNIAMAGYASERIATASHLDMTIYGNILNKQKLSDNWRKKHPVFLPDFTETGAEYIDVGYFEDLKDAQNIANFIQQRNGQVKISKLPDENTAQFNVVAVADNNQNDEMLRLIWQQGAQDAFIVR